VTSRLTVEELQRRLGHASISRSVEEDHLATGVLRWVVFTVHPRPETSPHLSLIFDGECRFIQSLHFGEKPHWHFTRSESEIANANSAVRVARALVRRRLHMVEQLDASGTPWSWSLQVKGGIPPAYDKRLTHYRRVYFDQPPGPPVPIPAEHRRDVESGPGPIG